jgi:site-specific recombinase XerD
MPRVGPHAARHSIADHLRRSGAPLSTISMVLGPSLVAATTAYLKGFDPEDVESELRRVLG